MTTLLHVNSSPRGEHSDSLKIATIFLDAYREHHPDATTDTLNLFDGSLPTFGRLAADAKIAHLTGRPTTAEEDAEWAGARKEFERFAAADRYLFNIPMWNNGIPYVLKQWIDIISQPGWTFGFDDNGYVPLLTDKKAAIVYTSGTFAPDRGPSYGRDFQSTYFEDWLNLIGVTRITETRLQPTILSPSFDEQRAASARWARRQGELFT
jgi:FMN-dependent NADH-azoreductase